MTSPREIHQKWEISELEGRLDLAKRALEEIESIPLMSSYQNMEEKMANAMKLLREAVN